jgi:pyruvate dehydrogenase E2 component (dihydrolipoamide acetyltransferase)
MKTFNLPDLGEGLQEAELVTWHVAVGDHVVADQPLVSVETDKAVVEIPSPWAGEVARLHGKPGDLLKVGAPLVDFAKQEISDSGTVVGRLPAGEELGFGTPDNRSGKNIVTASPAVRNRARQQGVDLTRLVGSGPDGSISLEDVDRAAPEADAGTAKAQTLRGVRRAMAKKMAKAHAEVVPATVNDLADISAWMLGEDITLRLIRAITKAAEVSPALNAWYLGEEEGRILHGHIDLGIAMDSEDGLFVPVLRNVSNRSRDDIRQGIEAMKADIQARRVPLAELRGQTITLSNFGMFGGRHAALVVLPPQVAIIGAGRIYQAVVPGAEAPRVARVLPISLTFDHRVVMGGEAARFLSALLEDLAGKN